MMRKVILAAILACGAANWQPCPAAAACVEASSSNDRDYYERKAREYAREAESYERKARGYRNDAEEAKRKAVRYYDEAIYYAKRGDTYKAKQNSRYGDQQLGKYDDYMRQAKNADERAEYYRRQERDARSKAR